MTDEPEIEERVRADCYKRGWNQAVEACKKLSDCENTPYSSKGSITSQIKTLTKGESK